MFLATSSFTVNLILLGKAERVFTLLGSEEYNPGLPVFGFSPSHYFDQLCATFAGAVVGYQPDSSYYTSGARAGVTGNFFGGVSASRMVEFPIEKIRTMHCSSPYPSVPWID